jgi:hypothetical protein
VGVKQNSTSISTKLEYLFAEATENMGGCNIYNGMVLVDCALWTKKETCLQNGLLQEHNLHTRRPIAKDKMTDKFLFCIKTNTFYLEPKEIIANTYEIPIG